jgi:predicted component of type VI protein secretion system
VDLFTTDFLDYEVEVCLQEEAVPELRLSWGSALLGWSTWLGTPPPEERRIRILFQGALHG